MYKNYNIKLTELEKLRLNLIKNQSIRNSCMSILSYLIKKHTEEIKEYINAGLQHLMDQTVFKISFRDFLKKYNRSHLKLSIGTLKNRIDLLLKLKLIKRIDKSTYSFFRHDLNKNLNKDLNKKNIDQTLENTSINTDSDKHKYINNKIDNKNNIINIINRPLSTKIKTFVTNIEEIRGQLQYYICKFNIDDKYAFVIKEIERRIKKVIKRGTLRFKGVDNYLINILCSIKNEFIPNCLKNKYKNHENNTVKKDTFNNYDQRAYDFDELESGLLGYKKINLNDCVLKDGQAIKEKNSNNIKIDTFNNHDQRTYDFDDLEKKLLGWD